MYASGWSAIPEKLYHLKMRTRWSLFAVAGLIFAGGFAASARQATTSSTATSPSTTQAQPARPNPNGWVLPENAADEKNPFADDPKAVAEGKVLFTKNCERCHGSAGKGDGKDADPDAMQDMDLTVARRATRNPDGVVFYKVWNGRKKPKMPAFKDEGLSKDQVWQIVSYAQTLRAKQ
jgi:mono/diheme cytochrome c family protein